MCLFANTTDAAIRYLGGNDDSLAIIKKAFRVKCVYRNTIRINYTKTNQTRCDEEKSAVSNVCTLLCLLCETRSIGFGLPVYVKRLHIFFIIMKVHRIGYTNVLTLSRCNHAVN